MPTSWKGNPDLDTVALDTRDRRWSDVLQTVLAILWVAAALFGFPLGP